MNSFLVHLSLACLWTACLSGTTVYAAQPPPEPQELARLLHQLAPQPAGLAAAPAPGAEAPRVSTSPHGFLRAIGAPPGQHFPSPPSLANLPPEAIALSFMHTNASLFGLPRAVTDFVMKRNPQSNGRSHVRLQQTHRGIPVVAAEVVVQVDASGGVECVLSDLAPDTQLLESNLVSLVPLVSSEDAAARARTAFTARAGGSVENSPPQLAIFAPSVLEEAGDPELVWDLEVFGARRAGLHYRVLVSAASGSVLREWTLKPGALNRQIFDQANNATAPAMLVRPEGQPPTGIVEVDNAYDFLGDTYLFYKNRHNRDSFDNLGAPLAVTVRYCETNSPCPYNNAVSGSPMIFGDGFAKDDIVAHEYTHNVTATESALIYTNASGAINESLSDVWGEFVDITNGSDNDTPENRWLVGEEMAGGAFRSMRNPTNFNHPDRLKSPLYQPASNTDDAGGVHSNSGVNNKLCYLLTDGDTFNGQTVLGMGIDPVERLYYEAQVNLLTSGAGWADLYNTLRQAAVNRGWSTADRNNLYRACLAVEIVGPDDGQFYFVDWTSNCGVPSGLPFCNLGYGPFLTVGQGVAGINPGDVLRIRTGNYHESMTITKAMTLRAENGPVTIGP